MKPITLPSLIIFPNPSDGIFYITGNSNVQSIEIFNQVGKLVYADPDVKNKTDHFS